jgi:hypothetical protein
VPPVASDASSCTSEPDVFSVVLSETTSAVWYVVKEATDRKPTTRLETIAIKISLKSLSPAFADGGIRKDWSRERKPLLAGIVIYPLGHSLII